jgi:peptidoglycan/LPS O-acetylase OafA/YrhL
LSFRVYCDRTLLLLLRTFLDIIALRKGPEHVPDSWLLLVLAIAMMVFALFSAAALIEALAVQNYWLTFATNMFGLMFYGVVLFVFGFSRRIVRALTCILGCGAILTVLFVAEYVLFRPVLGAGAAGTIATVIVLWSVPVEGHIVSRSIQQHWLVGVAIAVAAFILQLGFQSAFSART